MDLPAVPGLRRPRRTVLGTEFAGEVEAVGDGVTACKVGDRVFGFSGTTFGPHAECLVVPEDGLMAAIPEGLTFEEAATPSGRSQCEPVDLRRDDEAVAGQASRELGVSALFSTTRSLAYHAVGVRLV